MGRLMFRSDCRREGHTEDAVLDVGSSSLGPGDVWSDGHTGAGAPACVVCLTDAADRVKIAIRPTRFSGNALRG